MKMTIYKSIDVKTKIMELYDKQLDRLKCPYSDKWVSTSFGAGILAKTMCLAPKKIKRTVLYVPSGIKNTPTINSMSMMFRNNV